MVGKVLKFGDDPFAILGDSAEKRGGGGKNSPPASLGLSRALLVLWITHHLMGVGWGRVLSLPFYLCSRAS